MFPRLLVIGLLLLGLAEARAQSQPPPPQYQPAQPSIPPPRSDLFEASLGFNYIYLNDQFPETKNLYGVEGSLFINATSWLSAGGEFMADFGSRSVPVFFRRTADIDSERYLYLFGPRVTVWRDRDFRVFLEGLVGGVHAHATLTSGLLSRSADANGFAAVVGGGFDWRLTNHLAWRLVQADYLATSLGNDWQNNFRASTSLVYTFGTR
jgi:hypothetical protein